MLHKQHSELYRFILTVDIASLLVNLTAEGVTQRPCAVQGSFHK